MPNSFVSLQTNFIIISGPMAMTSSYFSPDSVRARSLSVTSPFSPAEPSSVIRKNASLAEAKSSLSITRLSERKPTILCTVAPDLCSFFAIGRAIALPTPPPMTATFRSPSVSVALPRGPTKSEIYSPAFLAARSLVVAPTV